MTKENKELLLQDLCARLPYGVNVKIINKDNVRRVVTLNEGNIAYVKELTNGWWKECKPFLRPMSSMTEEELYEVQGIVGKGVEIRDGFFNIVYSSIKRLSYAETQAVFDWLNKNHFDYRGLIPMGLAIAVTEENNPYK